MSKRVSGKSTEILPETSTRPEVEVVRSARRKKTVSARMQDDGRIRLLVPASSTKAEVTEYLAQLLPQILATQTQKENRKKKFASDEYLRARADVLIEKYLPGLTRPESIRWVTNQSTRWGSATPAQGRIRLSHVIQGAPEYVVDFVLHHELCHFVELHHSKKFRALENLFPRKAEAEAFLAGITFEQNRSA